MYRLSSNVQASTPCAIISAVRLVQPERPNSIWRRAVLRAPRSNRWRVMYGRLRARRCAATCLGLRPARVRPPRVCGRVQRHYAARARHAHVGLVLKQRIHGPGLCVEHGRISRLEAARTHAVDVDVGTRGRECVNYEGATTSRGQIHRWHVVDDWRAHARLSVNQRDRYAWMVPSNGIQQRQTPSLWYCVYFCSGVHKCLHACCKPCSGQYV